MGKVMEPRLAVFLTTVFLALGVLMPPMAMAASWTDAGFDMGIGLLGLKQPSNKAKLTVRGLWPQESQYSAAERAALGQMVFRRQPYPTHPVVGRFVFDEAGQLAIQVQDDLFPVTQSGLTLQDGTAALIVKKIQGNWAEVILNPAPQINGWIEVSPQRPLAAWLWYHFFSALVAAKQPVFFITPLRDDVLYQPNFKSLSPLKNVFQMEDAVLYPEKIDGAYMLVRMGQPADCKTSPVPRFEKVAPQRAWIKWLQNNGRPKIFEYQQPPDCNTSPPGQS